MDIFLIYEIVRNKIAAERQFYICIAVSWIKPHSEQSQQKCKSWDPLTFAVNLIFFYSSLSGQEKALHSSHLCQKLWCLCGQSQEASAPGLSAGGLLVLPVLWGK